MNPDPINTGNPKRPLWMPECAIAVCVYLGFVLLYYYPAFPTFRTALIGPPEDNMMFYWYLWYGVQAVFNPDWSFMHTKMIYYPEGVSLFYGHYFYVGILIGVFLKPFLSFISLYNFLIMQTYVVAGLAAFILIRYLTRNFVASLIGGFIYAFNPSHYAHSLHHVTVASIQFLPLVVYFFIRALREPKPLFIAGTTLFFVLSALSEWNYLVYCVLVMVFGAAYRALRDRRFRMSDLKVLIWVFGGAFILLSPLLVPMIMQTLKLPHVKLEGHGTYAADLMGFFVPGSYHLLANLNPIHHFNSRLSGNPWEAAAYLGMVNLILIGVSWRILRHEAKAYVWALAGIALFSLGTVLHVAGKEFQIPMPYDILKALPILTHSRAPSRIIVFAYLFTAILVAYSIRHLFFKKALARKSKALLALVACLIFLDFYSVARAVTPVRLPHAYQVIRNDSDRFAVLEIPWDSGRYMMYQTLHGIPNVQGYIGRKMNTSLVEKIPFQPEHFEIQKRLLIVNRVKYLVIHKYKLIRRSEYSNSQDEKAKEYNRIYRRFFQTVSNKYKSVYELVYDDAEASVFRVYK